MEGRVENLRKKYEAFKKGEDLLASRDETLIILEEARKKGNTRVVEELEDMLMDLEFLIEENKCKCHKKRSIC